jgi:hypothetical protein
LGLQQSKEFEQEAHGEMPRLQEKMIIKYDTNETLRRVMAQATRGQCGGGDGD